MSKVKDLSFGEIPIRVHDADLISHAFLSQRIRKRCSNRACANNHYFS